MKTDLQTTKNSAKELLLTALMFGLIVIAILSGGQLVGVIDLPTRVLPYLGGALIGYVLVAGAIVTHYCVKFMLNKKG